MSAGSRVPMTDVTAVCRPHDTSSACIVFDTVARALRQLGIQGGELRGEGT